MHEYVLKWHAEWYQGAFHDLLLIISSLGDTGSKMKWLMMYMQMQGMRKTKENILYCMQVKSEAYDIK